MLRVAHDSRSSSRVYLRYFEVPKGEGLSRSIADETPLNEMCNRPPCLNFPAIAEIIHVIANFSNANFLSADMLHWFHQIEIPSESGRTSVRRSICNEITKMDEQIGKHGHSFQIFCIKSKENPVDGLTREEHNYDIKEGLLSSALRAGYVDVDPIQELRWLYNYRSTLDY